jgi:hypothetical protein
MIPRLHFLLPLTRLRLKQTYRNTGRLLPRKERPDGIDIAPMADFFLCDGLPRPIPKTGFSTSLRPAVTLDDRPPPDNGILEHDPEKWPPVFRKDHAQPRFYRTR